MMLQRNAADPLPLGIESIPRLDTAKLRASLRYPLVWAHDVYLNSWVAWPYADDVQPYAPIRTEWRKLREQFKNEGYAVVKQLVARETAQQVLAAHWHDSEVKERWESLPGVKRRSANNLPLMRVVHQSTEHLVQYVVDEPIRTSYSFTAEYEHGSTMPAHTDRPQCLYNISLMLEGDPAHIPLSSWPLYIEVNGKKNRIELMPGDAVLYSGTRNLHWRDMMPSELQRVLGVFFHYVTHDFTGSLD